MMVMIVLQLTIIFAENFVLGNCTLDVDETTALSYVGDGYCDDGANDWILFKLRRI